MARMHQNESGKPATNRGKQPHKGGYHARLKPVNPFKIWWEIGGGLEPVKKVESTWKPGRKRKQS